MGLSQMLLPEFDQEMGNTRKTLERIPEDKLGWKPHEKSMTLGRLAGHLAELPGWGAITIQQDSFDVAPAAGRQMQPLVATSRQQVLEAFDKSIATARGVIAGVSDADWMKPWSLLQGGQKVFTMPKAAVFRSFVMNHSIHHRAQLGVYLRLNGVAVPSIYGPSADEKPF